MRELSPIVQAWKSVPRPQEDGHRWWVWRRADGSGNFMRADFGSPLLYAGVPFEEHAEEMVDPRGYDVTEVDPADLPSMEPERQRS